MCVTGEPDAVKAARPVRRGADGKVLRATGVTRRRPTLPLTQKVREAGRIVNVSVVVATAVNGEGKREIIGMDVGTSEDGAFWLAFLRSLSVRGYRTLLWRATVTSSPSKPLVSVSSLRVTSPYCSAGRLSIY